MIVPGQANLPQPDILKILACWNSIQQANWFTVIGVRSFAS